MAVRVFIMRRICKFVLISFFVCSACFSTNAQISEDFTLANWPGMVSVFGNYTNIYGWGLTNGFVSPLNECIIRDINGGPSYLCSPILTNNIGDISFSVKNNANVNPIVYEIQGSQDRLNWTSVIARMTNSSTTMTPYTIGISNVVDQYVRFIKISDDAGGTVDHIVFDNVVINENPTLLDFTDTVLVPSNPAVNLSVDVTTTILPRPLASNVTAQLYYSTNDGLSFIPTNTLVSGLTNFSTTIPGQPVIGLVIKYYYDVDFTYNGTTGVKDYYPSDGTGEILFYTNSLVLGGERTEDFVRANWPGMVTAFGNYVGPNGWSITNAIVLPNNVAVMANLYSNNPPSRIISPLLTNGIGSIYYEARNHQGYFQVCEIQTSPDRSTWATVATITNTVYLTNVQQYVSVNLHEDSYIRIIKTNDNWQANEYMYVDNITVSYPPADVIITNETYTKGYIGMMDSVTVSCDIYSMDNTVPASTLLPKLCYRMAGKGLPWTTNSMSKTVGNTYEATIPPQSRGQVEFFIRCDFDGYFHSQWGHDENQSPAYSPDAPSSQTQPDSFYFYEVRPYRSEYDYLSATTTAGNVDMLLIGDYTWSGVLDLSLNPQTSLTVGFQGYGQFTNGATEYSTDTNFWGDYTVAATYLPLTGSGGQDEAPISITGNFNGPISFQYDTRNNSYVLMNAFYQDFNTWDANLNYFERSIFGSFVTTTTNRLEGFTGSTTYFTTVAAGDAVTFDNWGGTGSSVPTINAYDDPAGQYDWWFVEDGIEVRDRGIWSAAYGNQNDWALAFKPVADRGKIWPHRSYLPNGLGTLDFDYRCMSRDESIVYIGNSNKVWNNMSVYIDAELSDVAPDAYVSLMARYTNAANREYMECRFMHETEWANPGHMDLRWNYASSGLTNNYFTSANMDNRSLGGHNIFEFIISTNRNGSGTLLYGNYYNGISFISGRADNRNEPALFKGGSAGFASRNCDFRVNYIMIRETEAQLFDGSTNGFGSATQWFAFDCITNGGSGYTLTNINSTIRSPQLSFIPDSIKFYHRRNSSGWHNFLIRGSTDGIGWTDITNVLYNTTDDRTATIYFPANVYQYIMFQGNTNNPTIRIDDVFIYGTNVFYNDFTVNTNGMLPTGSGWGFDEAADTFGREGYIGEPLGFVVDIVATNGATDDEGNGVGTWKTVYSNNAAQNSQYAHVSIDFETLNPFYPHGAPTWYRIRHTFGAGELAIDNIFATSWGGQDQTDAAGWRATEAWVVDNGTGDKYIDFWRSRAGTNDPQYIRSPLLVNGLGSIAFDYRCSVPPINLEIQTATFTDELSFATQTSVTFTNASTNWSYYSIPLNTNGAQYVRIKHVSTNRAVFAINNIRITDYKEIDDTMWIGYNTLITSTMDSREFEPAATPGSEYRTCYFNNSRTLDTIAGPYTEDAAYIQTPMMSNGIGRVSFWYRSWENNGAPQGKLILKGATNQNTVATNWVPLGSISGITNSEYIFFSTNLYLPEYTFLRITCDTNFPAPKRVCIDNLFIAQPLGANLVLTDLKTIPEVPLFYTPVNVSVRVTDKILSPSNEVVTLHYYNSTSPWGWANWTATESGSINMTNVGGTGTVYTTTTAIPARPIDDVVQFYVEASFMGDYSNSPARLTRFSNPSWYQPIDRNVGQSLQNPYYYSFSCTTGSVWINEYDIFNLLGVEDNQFIELCGQQGSIISNWQIHVISAGGGATNGYYTITNNTTLGANITNGFGFWLIATTNVLPRDQALTNTIWTAEKMRLLRSMGAWVDYVDDDDLWDLDAGSKSLQGGPGSYSGDFGWVNEVLATPRYANTPGQILLNALGANPYVTIDITDMWLTNNQTWLTFDIFGTNFIAPVPIYSTNLLLTNWYTVPSYNTTNSGSSYTQWWNNLTNNVRYFYRIEATNYF